LRRDPSFGGFAAMSATYGGNQVRPQALPCGTVTLRQRSLIMKRRILLIAFSVVLGVVSALNGGLPWGLH